MACILLRRMFSATFEEIWPQLPADMQNGLKQELMLSVREETVQTIRKKTCDAIAELARNLLGRISVFILSFVSTHLF